MFFEPQTQKGTLFPIAFTLSFIAGIGVYFGLSFEPERWVGLSVLITGLCWFLSRKSAWGFFLSGCLFWFCFGFSLITFKTFYLHKLPLSYSILSYLILLGIIIEF